MLRKSQKSMQKGTRKSAFFVSARRPPVRNPVLIAFHKPFGVLSQFTSSLGKQTLADFGFPSGVYPVGRLDEETEGLLLLTNDNEIKSRLTNPRWGHRKTYLVQVERVPQEGSLDTLRRGLMLRTEQFKPCDVQRTAAEPLLAPRPVPVRFRKNVPTAWLTLTIAEGRNRQVRRMTAAIGHPTLRLVRIRVAGVQLGDLQPGAWKTIASDAWKEK